MDGTPLAQLCPHSPGVLSWGAVLASPCPQPAPRCCHLSTGAGGRWAPGQHSPCPQGHREQPAALLHVCLHTYIYMHKAKGCPVLRWFYGHGISAKGYTGWYFFLTVPCGPTLPGADGLMDTCLFIIGAFEPEHLASTTSTPGAGRAAWPCCPPRFGPAAHYRTLEESRAIVSPFKQCRAASSSPAVLRCPAAGLLPQRCSPALSETFGNNDGRNGVCSPLQSHLDKWPGACDCLTTTYLGKASMGLGDRDDVVPDGLAW